MRKALVAGGVVVIVGFLGAWQFGFFDKADLLNPIDRVLEADIDPMALRWEEVQGIPWEPRDSHAVYIYRGALWMSGGLNAQDSKINPTTPDYQKAVYFNDIWKSEDGMRWEKVVQHAEFPVIRSTSVYERDGNAYMIGGWSPDEGYGVGMWKSLDGLDWTKLRSRLPFGNREGQRIVEFNGKIYMLGGVNYDQRKLFNDVWVTEDGENWRLVAGSNPWEGRWDFDVTVYKGKMWIAGGMAFAGVGYGDVWSSSDGVSWEKVADLAPWGKRQGQNLFTYKGRMWIVTGLDAATNEGEADTWVTEDGLNWQKVPAVGPWLGREDQAGIIFKDRMWILGGMDSEWNWHNDVWYAAFGEASS